MFRNTKKEKELIDREIAVYRDERMLAVNTEIDAYLLKRQLEIIDLEKRCSIQLGEYEHDFHKTKEVKGIELAKLEAKVETMVDVVAARQEVIKADNNLLKSKDKEIERLNDIVTLLIKEQPKHTTTLQQLK